MIKLKLMLMESYGDAEKTKWKRQNPTLSDAIIQTYIDKFDKIRKIKPKVAQDDIEGLALKGNDRYDISKYISWQSFEIFVDYVIGQISLKNDKRPSSLEIDAKPLVEKDGIQIFYADSPKACVTYKGNINYSWCVARPDASNMYYTYRYRDHQPAFYFVKNIERTKAEFAAEHAGNFEDPYHFFVIQVTKYASVEDQTSSSYIVTSANNDGDSHMSWNEIVQLEPKLEGMQKYFVPMPLSKAETDTFNRFSAGVDDDEFKKLTYEEKEKYIEIYCGGFREINDFKFKLLPADLKSKYIGYGIGLTDEQYAIVKVDKFLLKRYVQMSLSKLKLIKNGENNNGSSLDHNELNILIQLPNAKELFAGIKASDLYYLIVMCDNLQDMLNVLSPDVSANLIESYWANILAHRPDKEVVLNIIGTDRLKNCDSLKIHEMMSSLDKESTAYIMKLVFKYRAEKLSSGDLAMIINYGNDANYIPAIISNYSDRIDEGLLFAIIAYTPPDMVDYVFNAIKDKLNILEADSVYSIVSRLSDSEERQFDMMKRLGPTNIKKLIGYRACDLLKKTKNMLVMAKVLGPSQINSIQPTDAAGLIYSAPDMELAARILGKQKIDTMDGYGLTPIIRRITEKKYLSSDGKELKYVPTDPMKVGEILGSNIDKVNASNLDDLLKNAENPEAFIEMLLKYKTLEYNGHNNDVSIILKHCKDPISMAARLGKEKINTLDGYYVYLLLQGTVDKNAMATALGPVNINKLTYENMLDIFRQCYLQVPSVILKYRTKLEDWEIITLLLGTKDENIKSAIDAVGNDRIQAMKPDALERLFSHWMTALPMARALFPILGRDRLQPIVQKTGYPNLLQGLTEVKFRYKDFY